MDPAFPSASGNGSVFLLETSGRKQAITPVICRYQPLNDEQYTGLYNEITTNECKTYVHSFIRLCAEILFHSVYFWQFSFNTMFSYLPQNCVDEIAEHWFKLGGHFIIFTQYLKALFQHLKHDCKPLMSKQSMPIS